MFRIATTLWLLLQPLQAAACDTPVCLTDYDSLRLVRLVSFDDLASSAGPGRKLDDILVQPGVRFGERFAGQIRQSNGNYDTINGTALGPLTLVPGGPGETLGLKRLITTTVLLGYGPRRYPRREAIGEGAIAILFERDQSEIGFHIRGGEKGHATVIFLRRDGSAIQQLILGPLGEDRFGFVRQGGVSDIAGLVVYNDDPEGMALDDLRFEKDDLLGAAAIPLSTLPPA